MAKPISLHCYGLNHRRDVPVLARSVVPSRRDVRFALAAETQLATRMTRSGHRLQADLAAHNHEVERKD
jgi:hypothetical protein